MSLNTILLTPSSVRITWISLSLIIPKFPFPMYTVFVFSVFLIRIHPILKISMSYITFYTVLFLFRIFSIPIFVFLVMRFYVIIFWIFLLYNTSPFSYILTITVLLNTTDLVPIFTISFLHYLICISILLYYNYLHTFHFILVTSLILCSLIRLLLSLCKSVKTFSWFFTIRLS